VQICTFQKCKFALLRNLALPDSAKIAEISFGVLFFRRRISLKFLITFWTTTAAFRAEQALSKGVVNFSYKLIAVPVELAATCHGYGLLFSVNDAKQLEEPKKILSDAGAEWKAIWQMEAPFKKIEGDTDA
jgi:hypothetical protein